MQTGDIATKNDIQTAYDKINQRMAFLESLLDDSEKLVTNEKACEALKISPTYMTKAITHKIIAPVNPGGRPLKFKAKDIARQQEEIKRMVNMKNDQERYAYYGTS